MYHQVLFKFHLKVFAFEIAGAFFNDNFHSEADAILFTSQFNLFKRLLHFTNNDAFMRGAYFP
jgi:hypothetical protein